MHIRPLRTVDLLRFLLARHNTNPILEFEAANIVPASILMCRVSNGMGSFERVGGVHEAQSCIPSTSNKYNQQGSVERRTNGRESYLGRAAYTNSAHLENRDNTGPAI